MYPIELFTQGLSKTIALDSSGDELKALSRGTCYRYAFYSQTKPFEDSYGCGYGCLKFGGMFCVLVINTDNNIVSQHETHSTLMCAIIKKCSAVLLAIHVFRTNAQA